MLIHERLFMTNKIGINNNTNFITLCVKNKISKIMELKSQKSKAIKSQKPKL